MTNYATPSDHAAAVTLRVACAINDKYHKGQVEHGGRLWKKPVIQMIGQEITDLNVYHDVLIEQCTRVRQLVNDAFLLMSEDQPGFREVYKALNILIYGNEEGSNEPDK